MRVVLGGERGEPGRFSTQVALDGDRPGRCTPCQQEDTTPAWGQEFRVQERGRDYVDENGTPRWSWTSIGSGRGILRVTRVEADDTTGHTAHTGAVVIGWDSDSLPTETAALVDAAGLRWQITAVDTDTPGALRLTVRRVSDAE